MHSSRGPLLLPIFSLLALCATSAPSLGQTVWTAGTAGWFKAANWSAGVPTQHQDAAVNNGGTAQILAGGATSGNLTLGSAVGDSGNLLVSGSGRFNGDFTTVYVGYGGSGTLNILNGGVMTTPRFVIGNSASSDGIATVSGPGSTWTTNGVCFVGVLGQNATLNITAGGQVSGSGASIGEAPRSHGVVLVDGSGSTWTHSGNITVGGDGSGTLTITNGGKVFTDPPGFFGSEIGRNPGASGVVTIDGAGSAWSSGGSVTLAENDNTTGTLSITNGGSMSNSYSIVGGDGGQGSATVEGSGSTWTHSGTLNVSPYDPADGGMGVVNIRAGGKVSCVDARIGPGTGSVLIDGTGSSWVASGQVTAGMADGSGQPAVVRITHGGTMSTAGTTVYKAGLLQLGVGNIKGPLKFVGGSIQTINNIDLARNFTVGTGGVRVQTASFHSMFSGNISGPGGLTKTALHSVGSIDLTGANTYTGPTAVNGGTLFVDGSITSPTTVNKPGTFGGSGTVGAVTVNSGGRVAPGHPVGRLSINGNYTQTSGGTLTIDLGGYEAATQFDQLVVSGGAQIDGTLNVALVNGFQPKKGDTFQIIVSGSETGTFTTINTSGFTARCDPNANGIVLTIVGVQ